MNEFSYGGSVLSIFRSITEDLNGKNRDETIERLNRIVTEYKNPYPNIQAITGAMWDYLVNDDQRKPKDIIDNWEKTMFKQRMEIIGKTRKMFIMNRDIVYMAIIIALVCGVFVSFKYGEQKGHTPPERGQAHATD